MSLIFSLTKRLEYKLSNTKIFILEIFAIAIVLYFAMIFIAKYVKTGQDIDFYKRDINTDKVIYQLDKIYDLPGDNYSISAKGDLYADIAGKEHKIKSQIIDKKYSSLYPGILKDFEGNSEFFRGNNAIVSETLKRKYNLKKGSFISIENKDFEVLGFVDNYILKDRVILPYNSLNINKTANTFKYYLTISSKDSKKLEDKFSYNDKRDLSDIYREDILSLRELQRFILSFSIIFVSIAVVNIILIIKSKFVRESKFLINLHICGESSKIFFVSAIIDYMFLTSLSFFLSLILYYTFIEFVPDFFYFKLNYNLIIVEFFVVTLLSIVIGFVLGYKERNFIDTNIRGSHAL